jgi:hypothetical protein
VAVGRQAASRRLTLGTVVASIVALLGACSNASSPSPVAEQSAGSSPVVSSVSSPSAQRSGASQASPTSQSRPKPTPVPTAILGPLVIKWQRQTGPTTSTSDGWSLMADATVLDDHGSAILNVDTDGAGPQVWISADGRHWGAATVPDPVKGMSLNDSLSLRSIAIGGPGLLAVGEFDDTLDDTSTSVLWASVDGRSWDVVQDLTIAQGIGLQWVGSVGGNLIAFGAISNGGVNAAQDWTSTDGLHWQVGSSASAAQVADGLIDLESVNGALTAFVGPPTDTNDHFLNGKSIEVWRATDVGNWQQVGTLPGSTSPEVHVAQGPLGWIATGFGAKDASVTWLSADGATWRAAGEAPDGAEGGLVVDASGFIATGFRNTSQGCVAVDKDNIGETWTSADGRLWRQMPEDPQFKGAAIQAMLIRDGTLIGIGLDWNAKATGSVVWTAPLPTASTAAGPTPVPSQKPVSVGCGD